MQFLFGYRWTYEQLDTKYMRIPALCTSCGITAVRIVCHPLCHCLTESRCRCQIHPAVHAVVLALESTKFAGAHQSYESVLPIAAQPDGQGDTLMLCPLTLILWLKSLRHQILASAMSAKHSEECNSLIDTRILYHCMILSGLAHK